MSFIESRFLETIAFGSKGGPVFSTAIAQVNSGAEYRNANWQYPLHQYDITHGMKTAADKDAVIATFMACQGRANGFRYKDWNDYTATISNGVLGTGYGAGTPTALQMFKAYNFGSTTLSRKIRKPCNDGSVKIYRGGVLQTAGSSAGNYAIDYTTGLITFVADSSKSITAITKANPGQVTATGHGYSTGQTIYLSGIGGMTQLNGNAYVITVVDVNNFTIGVNTTSYTTYTSGGTAAKYAQPSEALIWAGNFDVPVRFNADQLQFSADNVNAFSWQNIMLTEIRV